MSVPDVDIEFVKAFAQGNCSHSPVITARYMVEIVLNEAYYGDSEAEHKKRLAADIQRCMDDHDFTQDIRYDAVVFDVVSREVLDEAPANYPEDAPPLLPS